MVYAAQPREGTETRYEKQLTLVCHREVYAAQPREGTETRSDDQREQLWIARFMQLNPAR